MKVAVGTNSSGAKSPQKFFSCLRDFRDYIDFFQILEVVTVSDASPSLALFNAKDGLDKSCVPASAVRQKQFFYNSVVMKSRDGGLNSESG